MRLISRLTVVYFFLLLIVGCMTNDNIPSTFKIGDRVKIKYGEKEFIGTVIKPDFSNFYGTYSYRVYCNNDYSYYNEENLEIVDPMPGSLEEASWQNKKVEVEAQPRRN